MVLKIILRQILLEVGKEILIKILKQALAESSELHLEDILNQLVHSFISQSLNDIDRRGD